MLATVGFIYGAAQAGAQQTKAAAMVDFKSLDAAVVANLTDAERQRSAAYLNETLFPAGTATIAGQQLAVDHDYVTAFIDRNPGANWMHPCRYLLIDPSDKTITAIESDRPPVFGVLPPSWRLVARSPDLEDWRLIRIAPGP